MRMYSQAFSAASHTIPCIGVPYSELYINTYIHTVCSTHRRVCKWLAGLQWTPYRQPEAPLNSQGNRRRSSVAMQSP